MAIMPDMSISLPRIERDLVLESTPDRGIKGPVGYAVELLLVRDRPP
jgi:hypothetical protein